MLSTKTLLTGATGFIGSHILEVLTAAGVPAVALARPASNLAFARGLGADIRFGDLRDPRSLQAAARGCGQVIHAAAMAGDWGSSDLFHDTNVTGTLNLLEVCRRQGIRNVIMAGSISSYGEEDSSQIKDETFPDRSHYPYFLDPLFPSGMNRYRDSKAAATLQGMAFAREHRLNLTVLEPVWVYGEREFGTGFYAFLKAVQEGQRLMPGSTRNQFHVIYARDLARAFLLATQHPPPGVERLIVGDRAAAPMQRVFSLFCRAADLPEPRRLPKWAAYPVGFGLELFSTLARRKRAPLLTRGRVNMFYDSIQYSAAKAQRLLGFECRYTLEQGIRQTVDWYINNHYL